MMVTIYWLIALPFIKLSVATTISIVSFDHRDVMNCDLICNAISDNKFDEFIDTISYHHTQLSPSHSIESNVCDCKQTNNTSSSIKVESIQNKLSFFAQFDYSIIAKTEPSKLLSVLRIYSIYQNAAEFFNIDSALAFLQSQSVIMLLESSDSRNTDHGTNQNNKEISDLIDTKTLLLNHLIELLPSDFRPNLFHLNYDDIFGSSDSSETSDSEYATSFVWNLLSIVKASDDSDNMYNNNDYYYEDHDTYQTCETKSDNSNCHTSKMSSNQNIVRPPTDLVIDSESLLNLIYQHSTKFYESVPNPSLNTYNKVLERDIGVKPSECAFPHFEDRLIINKLKTPQLKNITRLKTDKKVLCMTYTISTQHNRIADIIHTWGRKCDGYLAFSNSTDENLNIIEIVPYANWKEDYNHIWHKIQYIIKIIVASSLNTERSLLSEFDYFLFGGDDLFLIIENLKMFLNSKYLNDVITKNGTKPVLIGKEMNANKYIKHVSGGSGYILNRASIITLYNQLTETPITCMTDILASMEDLLVSQCLRHAGVEIMSVKNIYKIIHDVFPEARLYRDSKIKKVNESENSYIYEEIFHPLSLRMAYLGGIESYSWYKKMAAYNYATGLECCSPYSISFHYIRKPDYDMKCLYYEIYKHIELWKDYFITD